MKVADGVPGSAHRTLPNDTGALSLAGKLPVDEVTRIEEVNDA
jgi:hypothetical protein